MEDTNKLPFDQAIGDILGITNCLRIIADTHSVQRWFTELKRHDDDNIPGYKLVFDTLFRMLVSELERNISLGISTDELFERATFRGISISKLPNSCEKAILIRNLQTYYRDILRCTNWLELQIPMHKLVDEVLNPFSAIRHVASLNNRYPVHNLEEVIRYSSMFLVYIFLNDTSREFPHGYMPTMINEGEFDSDSLYSRSRLPANVFVGYKRTVQFLWSQLLGTSFQASIVNDIDKTENWASFDRYFKQIQSSIIEPIEKTTRGFMGYDFFVLITGNPRQYLEDLLKETIQESSLSRHDTIQRLFRWYPIQLVDSSSYNYTGAPVFIPLLMGIIQKKRRAKEKDKATVIRIIHGSAEQHRRSYSYAILVELFGNISDSSGWMLFYDCCDDRGSTSVLFDEIERLLNRYEVKDFISIETSRIEKDTFLSLIEDNLVSHLSEDQEE